MSNTLGTMPTSANHAGWANTQSRGIARNDRPKRTGTMSGTRLTGNGKAPTGKQQTDYDSGVSLRTAHLIADGDRLAPAGDRELWARSLSR